MKKFAGFNPRQTLILLQKMGYTGSEQQDEMDDFIAASPQVQAKLGRYSMLAQKRLNPELKMSDGGVVWPQHTFLNQALGLNTSGNTGQSDASGTPPTGTGSTAPNSTQNYTGDAQSDLDNAQAALAQATFDANNNPNDPDAQKALQDAQNALTAANTAFAQTEVPSANEAHAQAISEPTTLVTPANVAQITEDPSQIIQPGTGQATDQNAATTTTVDQTATATAAPRQDVATVDPTLASDQVNQALDQTEAATADPTEKATVRGQLEMLMQDFEGGETPPWASGAMREAMAIMQRRGLGASSMAGAAIVQAAMESAISIAQADAQTFAAFEMQNLNNRQATTIFKTQQRIAGILSDQAQENAAKQFNAASENQVNQFFADLETTVSRFNAEQVNAIRQFNAGEMNTTERFNANLEALRDQFNAQNDLIIAQANTQWRQDIATTNTTAQNEANMEAARQANQLTQRSIDQIWQRERDLMSFAFAGSESLEDRNLQLLLADKSIDFQQDSAKKEALGYLVGKVLGF